MKAPKQVSFIKKNNLERSVACDIFTFQTTVEHERVFIFAIDRRRQEMNAIVAFLQCARNQKLQLRSINSN